jgi:MoxR-like ATPase
MSLEQGSGLPDAAVMPEAPPRPVGTGQGGNGADRPGSDIEAVQEVARAREQILAQVRKRIVGQDEVLEQLLVAMFARGHVLFVGVPGLAKTLLISTLAAVLELDFKRIQFTPDLMPSDITGTEILEEDQSTRRRSFRFVNGPIFCNILLADEINRTPPKTQAALLQSMQEYRVTSAGQTFPLPLPFHVFATQNPIEQEGTYPLPEAQLDRFMFQVDVGYPSEQEEVEIVRCTTGAYQQPIQQILGPAQLLQLQELVLRVPAPEYVVQHAVQLARATRPGFGAAPAAVKEYVAWGAGPRAGQYLVLGAKARAVLQGRTTATVDDVRALALPVLRHRIITNFHAEAERVSATDLVATVLQEVLAS